MKNKIAYKIRVNDCLMPESYTSEKIAIQNAKQWDRKYETSVVSIVQSGDYKSIGTIWPYVGNRYSC